MGHGAHYHSQSVESFFTQVPGLKVVVPRSPREAKGLLLSSIRDPNPVLFFEHKGLYRTAKEEVFAGDLDAKEAEHYKLGVAEVLREGGDITVVGYGAQIGVLSAAAEVAATQYGIECEVIDLRTLAPWDVDTVCASVNKTGRLLISHEAPISGGFGAEVVATVSKRCFLRLEAPPMRVCGADIPFPLVYEPFYMPTQNRVLEGIKEAVGF